ncbi:MAG TPA: DNA primase [Holophagaceae bacterium]|nr:DNA primase [Holophagaceae bacterium]
MKDRELVNRVKDATDLLTLVGQAVKLKKAGASWTGLCPFHAERSPSFQVVPEKGFYHCFGCGKHGDAFSWLMEREGMTFPEALETLARHAGIEMPKQRERSSEEVDAEARLRSALDAAQAFFERELERHGAARTYLRERGITEAFGKEAGFGVAPDAWDRLIDHLKGLGFSGELLEQAGLVSRTERGTLIDFLRDRLTLPIHDARGRIVAFAGRAFGDAKPKYMNTRETALFKKGETLFGFHRAKGQMRDGALIVEGYFDVLQLHQQGIHAAVAPMGTSLTEEHLKQIGRFSRRLVLCFDGDAAGRRAMDRTLRMALPHGFEIRLLELPQGEDPDTWCLRMGPDAFRDLLRQAPDWTAFVINRSMDGKDMRRIGDRMEAFKDLSEFIPFLPRTAENREVLVSLAHQLQLPMQEVERVWKRGGATAAEEPQPPPVPADLVLDEQIRALVLLARAGHAAEVATWPSAWWEALSGAPVLQALLDAEGDDAALPPEVLKVARALEADLSRRDAPGAMANPEATRLKLENAYVMRELQALQRQLADPRTQGEAGLASRLEASMAELLVRKSRLAQSMKGR